MTTIEETMDALNELKKRRKDPCHRRRNVNMDHLREYVKWGTA